MIFDFLRLIAAFVIAVFAGMLFKKLRLPYVLAWLLAGILLSPFALGLVPSGLESTDWYKLLSNFIKFGVGATLGIGSGSKKEKGAGRKYFIVSSVESLSTFAIVSFAFALLFLLTGESVFTAFLFGSIAMVTSLATSAAILKSYNASGPLSSMAIPVMSISSLLGIVTFMVTLSLVVGSSSTNNSTSGSILFSIAGSLGTGLVFGFISTLILGKIQKESLDTTFYYLALIIGGLATVFLSHLVFTQTSINYLISGVFFSLMLPRNISEPRMKAIQKKTETPLGLVFAFFILTLGLSINYQFILSAGVLTLLFLVTRIGGKVGAAALGTKLAGIQQQGAANFGFFLLPHASICLIFTAIATENLGTLYPHETEILQGTLMAALLINEIIAPLLIKRALMKSGEFGKSQSAE